MDNKFYTVDEVAQKLNVSSKSVRRYICNGKLEGVKVGGQWRIEVESYNKFAGIECCSRKGDEEISKDDFCVFMDTDYFTSEDKIQLCTIIDYYSDTVDEITKMSEVLSRVVTEDGVSGGKAQYNYVYDQELKRARFILWGNATFIEKATALIKQFEGGTDA